METELYKILREQFKESGLSLKKFSKEINICYGTLVKFFNPKMKFSPFRYSTVNKLLKLGISENVVNDYNTWAISQNTEKGE